MRINVSDTPISFNVSWKKLALTGSLIAAYAVGRKHVSEQPIINIHEVSIKEQLWP